MKKFLGIISLVLLGLFLRLIFIDKPDGLWNDEYVSWMIAAKPFSELFGAIIKQCHMPFYYIYLKFCMLIFGQNDTTLRITSVIPGVLSIVSMYFVGKEKDKITGYLCAGFTAISSFLIYFSQEVRLYSILYLFSSICLLYTIRLVKSPNRKNFLICFFFNFLILITHTIGFVLVFFNLIFISVNSYKKAKKYIIGLWILIITGLILSFPLAFKIMTTNSFSQWWGDFSLARIGFLFSDYFSPILTNLTNAPNNFFYGTVLRNLGMLIPSLFAIFFVAKSLYKNKINQQLFWVCIGVILVMITASLFGKLVFITKYSIEIYPILIYLACYGLSSLKNKKVMVILALTYFLISIGYILFHKYSAPKMRRAEGHKIVTDMLNHMDLNQGDFIILHYYDKDRFEKYFDFSKYNVISMNKGNFMYYIADNGNYENIYKDKLKYRYIFQTEPNKKLTSILKNDILNYLQPSQSVVLILLDSVSFYNPEEIRFIADNEYVYEKKPLLFLVFSYLKKETFYYLEENLFVSRIERKGKWTTVKFTKLNK